MFSEQISKWPLSNWERRPSPSLVGGRIFRNQILAAVRMTLKFLQMPNHMPRSSLASKFARVLLRKRPTRKFPPLSLILKRKRRLSIRILEKRRVVRRAVTTRPLLAEERQGLLHFLQKQDQHSRKLSKIEKKKKQIHLSFAFCAKTLKNKEANGLR